MDKVTVLVCRTNEAAEVVEIPNNMGGVQTLLGADDLEEITPWTKDVVVVFSSKAQANPSNLNRRLYAEDGTPVITVHGDFIMALMPHGCKEFLPIPSMYVDRYGKFMEVVGDGVQKSL